MALDDIIYTITEAEALEIIAEYERQLKDLDREWEDKDIGLFMCEHADGTWTAIDNKDGYAWTEDFRRKEVAEKWLLGHYEDIEDLREEDKEGTT